MSQPSHKSSSQPQRTAASHSEQLALEIVRRLRQAGHEALWAGGCVRDLLVGREPSDFDVATSATPEQVRHVLGKRRTLPVGAAFGVVVVLGRHGENPVEVATFRSDGPYSDGRHPDAVTYSTAEHDAQRRDFTINGMFYDPISGQTLDYVGGCEDLRRGIVRAIGNPAERFREDKLRMLRAVRFAATFDFSLEQATAEAIRQQASEIVQVSAERTAGELRRMLTHARRRRAVELLDHTGLLPAVLPPLPQLGRPREALRPTATGLAVLESLAADATFATALAALLGSLVPEGTAVDPEVVGPLRDAWRLTNHETHRLIWLLQNISLVARAQSVAWPRLQRVLIHEGTAELMDWLAAQVAAGLVDSEHYQVCQRYLSLPPESLNPPPLIDGNDLRQHGVPRGPLYRELLQRVRDAQLEGQITDRQGALQWVDGWLTDCADGS